MEHLAESVSVRLHVIWSMAGRHSGHLASCSLNRVVASEAWSESLVSSFSFLLREFANLLYAAQHLASIFFNRRCSAHGIPWTLHRPEKDCQSAEF